MASFSRARSGLVGIQRVGISRGPVILIVKSEFGELQILFGAGDFSPQNAYIFGTSVFGFAYAVTGKSRAPTDMHPANCRFDEQI